MYYRVFFLFTFLLISCELKQNLSISSVLLGIASNTSLIINGTTLTSEIAIDRSSTTINLNKKVNPDKTILNCSVRFGSNTPASNITCFLNSNGDSFRIDTGGDFSGTIVKYDLIEFSSGITVSRGELEVSPANLGKFLDFKSPLDLKKTFIIQSARFPSTNTALDSYRLFKSSFLSDTKVELKRNTGLVVNSIPVISYQIIKIDESNIQSGEISIANGSSSNSVKINSVNLSKAFLVFSLNYDDSNGEESSYYLSGRILNSNTLEFKRKGTLGNINISYSVIEFSGSPSVQSGEYTVTETATAGVAELKSPISDSTKSFILFSNNISSSTQAASSLRSSGFTINFSNSSGSSIGNTHLNIKRSQQDNNSGDISYFILQF